jgi:hypothetical protein
MTNRALERLLSVLLLVVVVCASAAFIHERAPKTVVKTKTVHVSNVEAIVSGYVLTNFAAAGVAIDFYKVNKVTNGPGGSGTVFYTLSFDRGKAYRFKSRVVCMPVPGSPHVCFATGHQAIT